MSSHGLVVLVRSLVLLVSFALSMLLFRAASEATWSYALLMSACIAAVVCTVATRSGRVAGRRIVRGSTEGWRRRA